MFISLHYSLLLSLSLSLSLSASLSRPLSPTETDGYKPTLLLLSVWLCLSLLCICACVCVYQQNLCMYANKCITHTHAHARICTHWVKELPVIVLMSGLASVSCNHVGCVLSALSVAARRRRRIKEGGQRLTLQRALPPFLLRLSINSSPSSCSSLDIHF